MNLWSDEWLSAQMERPCYRVEGAPDEQGVAKLKKEGAFAYAKIGCSDANLVQAYQRFGFAIVDCNVTLRQAAAAPKSGNSTVQCEFAQPADETAVVQIAETSFTMSRFHLDPEIAPATANKVKGAWVRNFFSGKRGDALVVARDGSKVAGFTLLLKGKQGWVIDLIAVAPGFQGKGAGRAMVEFINEKHGALTVGTQVANAKSLQFYESLGFRTQDSKYVLHFHGGRAK